MDKKLIALISELDKVMFEFGGFEHYIIDMGKELKDKWVASDDVVNIVWFFENMFFDEVDMAIIESFKANIKEEKYHSVMANYDVIMEIVKEFGKEYNNSGL